jgi:uncharacterized membrane protein YdjX (TVP38/TMEM64 family)
VTSKPHQLVLIATAAIMATWSVISYLDGGFVFLLMAGSTEHPTWVQTFRDAVATWGNLAPVIYTFVVVVEVVIAPIPGPLLYAPAGALFGGLLGGTLSLIGNVIGAAIACALGSIIGERLLPKRDRSQLGRYQELLRQKGIWIVLLLRANPFTSSDLVSYAAGIAGLPPWKVALGTLGIAPLCYLQAYFAERLFDIVPGRVLVIGGLGLAAAMVAVLVAGWKPNVRAEP